MSGDNRSTAVGPSLHWILFGAIVLALTGFGAWFGIAIRSQPPVPLEIDVAELDFGSQWAQRRFQWTIPVKNTSSQVVEVRGVRISCSCLDVVPKLFSVPAQSSTTLSFTLDLTANLKWDSPEVLYNQEFVLLLGDTSPIAAQSFRLKGMVRCPLLAPASAWRLAPAQSDGTAWSVPIKATRPFQNIRVQANRTNAFASIRPDAVEPQQWWLELKLHVDERGYTDIPITLQPEAMTEKSALPELQWKFRAEIISPIQVIPEDVDFGLIVRDTIAKQRVTFRRSDGKSCRVSELRTPSGIRASVLDTADAGVATVEVEATFQTAGLQQSVIEVTLAEANSGRETLRVPVRAFVESQSSPVESGTP